MTLESLSIFVGTGDCNADCAHCAGKPLRQYAPEHDGEIEKDLIERTMQECYARGARRLSISGSGEPTLSPMSVTGALSVAYAMEQEGKGFSPINLYTNGIRIGADIFFCHAYLPLWRRLGLTTMYVTVHDIDPMINARRYGVDAYPPLDTIVERIHDAGLQARANIVLQKRRTPYGSGPGTCMDVSTFRILCSSLLQEIGFDTISAWPIRTLEDKVDERRAPPESELDAMARWAENSEYADRIRVLLEGTKVSYARGEKLTLFPDGTLSNTWCN